MPLTTTQHVAFDPEFNREIGGAEVVGAGIGKRHGIIHPVKRHRLAVGRLACHPEGAVDQRAGMACPGGIGQRGPAPFVHP